MSLWLQAVWLRRGPWAWALRPWSAVYAMLAWVRAMAYRRGWFSVHALPVPVVVVGNLIAGGAGKTPTVMAIVARQRALGRTPGIVSRGHGRRDDTLVEVQPDMPAAQAGDEPLLMRLRTGAPVVVGRDRVAAARELLRRHPEVDLIVSDDGLQHLRLARQAQVIVFDERGVGNGWRLPAGPLREPLPDHVPPRSVVLYNAAAPTTRLPGHLARRRLAGARRLAEWAAGMPASMTVLQGLHGRRMVAAAGVARPERFFAMLDTEGLQIDRLPLPDHHDYASLPWSDDVLDVVVTEKDAVKLVGRPTGRTRIWVAALDFLPDAGFDAALAALLPPPPSSIPHGNSLA